MKLSKFFTMVKALEEMYPDPDNMDIFINCDGDELKISMLPLAEEEPKSTDVDLTNILKQHLYRKDNEKPKFELNENGSLWHTETINLLEIRIKKPDLTGLENPLSDFRYTGFSTKNIIFESISVRDEDRREYEWGTKNDILYIKCPGSIPNTDFYIKYMKKKEKVDETK